MPVINDGIAPYHSVQIRGRRGLPECATIQHVGIEYEVEIDVEASRSRSSLVGDVARACRDFEAEICIETDGSLHNGMEIISQPLPATLYMGEQPDAGDPLPTIINCLRDYTNLRAFTVGMHVNVGADSEEHAGAVAYVTDHIAPYIYGIAGRGPNYTQRHTFTTVAEHRTGGGLAKVKVVRPGDAESRIGLYGGVCDCDTCRAERGEDIVSRPPAAWRNEFRIFRSTNDPTLARLQIHTALAISWFSRECDEQIRGTEGNTITQMERQEHLMRLFLSWLYANHGGERGVVATNVLRALVELRDVSRLQGRGQPGDWNLADLIRLVEPVRQLGGIEYAVAA